MEGLIQHFELIMPNRGMESPINEVYAAVESPNGELGYYLVDRRQPDRLAGAHAAPVVHPFSGVPPHDQGSPDRRRRRDSGKPEHHRRRTRPLMDRLRFEPQFAFEEPETDGRRSDSTTAIPS